MQKQLSLRSWFFYLLAIFVGVIVVKNFVGEIFYIPSESMEDSMFPGDYVWVNKLAYGPRFPKTILALPFANNKLPFTKGTSSYLRWISFPYWRLPGYTHIKHNDIVVFNYPPDDSIPVDKKTNYVKRCIGLPGDTLTIRDKIIFINGIETAELPLTKYSYEISANSDTLSLYLFQKMNLYEGQLAGNGDKYDYLLTKNEADTIRKLKGVYSVKRASVPYTTNTLFPGGEYFMWSKDNYGPIVIPKKNTTIHLNIDSISMYSRIIETYENHTFETHNDSVFIDRKYCTQYTFKMNYYFMMGDNRDNSEDSRFWGFVPEDHIIGKASLTVFSLSAEKKSFWSRINWHRIFRWVK